MSSKPDNSISPPPANPNNANTGGVRRHHTISAASAARRPTPRIAAADDLVESHPEQQWNDDYVDGDWVGSMGAVGEKPGSGLHRQASLPTRYHRTFGSQAARQPNSLTAIAAGHDGEEEEWEREMRGLRNDDEHPGMSVSDHGHGVADDAPVSPLSPAFAVGGGLPLVPSSPPGTGGVRRHQSLHSSTGVRRAQASGLRRAGTLQIGAKGVPTGAQSPSPTNAEEEHEDENTRAEEESYFAPSGQQGGQYPGSPIGRSSPWSTPGGEWRPQVGGNGTAFDEVSRAFSSLEISGNVQQGQSVHPPRFNPSHPPPAQAPGMRGGNGNGNDSRKLQLVTDVEARHGQAVQSASAYVPPIGHGLSQPVQTSNRDDPQTHPHQRDRAFTASGGAPWENKERLLVGRASNPDLKAESFGQNIPSVPSIPLQYLQNQAPRLGAGPAGNLAKQGQGNQGVEAFLSSPIDVPTLIATKGYNPPDFNTRPIFARYFVIKSYTEDDVHKSLKHEIWSSTEPGNKRLDKAFRDTAGRGPIYLFFSVNGSGHFCGMAEMLTPVDHTRSSTVWASDKWKGVFRVKWVFVRDIPNATLRHIRLINTQERKPVTNSRDTQELLPDAGQEMLHIFHQHPARTSLLQDFAFYELQSMQKAATNQATNPTREGALSPSQGLQGIQPPSGQAQGMPLLYTGQHPYAMSNPAALAFAASAGGYPGVPQTMGTPFANSPAMSPAMQNIMRNTSPGPVPTGAQHYMNYGNMQF